MGNLKINVVSLDVPFPPNYGGVIDIYNRLKALKENGCYIILHCFEYGRGRMHKFQEVADEIFYYDRHLSILDFFSTEPFIVKTRKNKNLIENLNKNNYPILLEGQHCTSLLTEKTLSDRKIYVRIHNIEWQYYRNLKYSSKNILKKFFYTTEAWKLKKQEKTLSLAKALFPLIKNDVKYYSNINQNTIFWNAGFNFSTKRMDHVIIKDQCLFHGNLSVEENEKIALYLLKFWRKRKITKKLIIAGKDPNEKLFSSKLKTKNIEIIPNPSEDLMAELIQESKYNLLLSLQATGIKIKLLNSLVAGNICVANSIMVEGTGLDEFCEIFNSEDDLERIIYSEDLTFDSEKRKKYLVSYLNPKEEAKKIIQYIIE